MKERNIEYKNIILKDFRKERLKASAKHERVNHE